MLKRIKLLPNWAITNKKPAFYDTESATVIEETALLYGKIQELIIDHNSFIEEMYKRIIEFESSTTDDLEKFKNCMITLIHNYIHTIDEKIKLQDSIIKQSSSYMKDNIVSTTQTIVNNMVKNGEIIIIQNYDEQTESLNMVVTEGGSE